MLEIKCGMTVKLKKKHPCGGDRFKILYLASDAKIVCETCKKSMVIPRVKFEKMIKDIIDNA